ncbi:hypothetical protein P3342_007236 [Pyrenophora teres f. teres]|uniref:Helitron like N domain containing protein n=1 Tax=Pyrenophora teres f. teres TaxID=97479 RepID=A0A6S6W1J1_9PLEO|nr:hypothetical protein HRS9139_05718 [Pyrenophora teres f. teres]KAE8840329.1 hypothetical protein PTNB85_03728 [Pyrenophora teres f. teres]KAE8863828.1 hypothetical protein PTNB29_03792 [Pyrenophora teres f. teres]KAK1913990.1 hypothetical protein P3342_007236 [Pyrenophora teres f. teres]CAE7034129.1 Helitron like N domain containing protein [Pyrenophora teres f. teres]
MGDGEKKPGLFGKAKAYYGTVETNQHGGFHLHYQVWLADMPENVDLREQLSGTSENAKRLETAMREYIDGVFHNNIPGYPPDPEVKQDLRSRFARKTADNICFEPPPKVLADLSSYVESLKWPTEEITTAQEGPEST